MSVSITPLRFGQRVLLTALCLVLALKPFKAEAMTPNPGMPSTGLEGIARAVPDSELAEMRGKYISPDAVSFFGIYMVTSWQDANGITTNAKLAFSVDFLNQGNSGIPQTQFLIGWTRDGDPDMDITDTNQGYTPIMVASEIVPAGGLGTTTGAVQANIIAGADNLAKNTLQVKLVPRSALGGTPSGEGLTSANGTTAMNFSDGDSLEFRITQNQIDLVLTGNNGIDSSMQSVGMNMGQILQQTILNSAHNDVINNLRIVFGTDMLPGTSNAAKMAEVISSLKGNGF